MARILVTGAGGFIGQAVCPALAAQRHQVIAGVRRSTSAGQTVETLVLGDIGPSTAWAAALDGIDIVIHLAQRAHAGPDPRVLAAEPGSAAALVRAAAGAGARRLVLLSSVKAMGEATAPGRPFRPDDTPRPEDAYGRAKLASEQAAAAAAHETGLELVLLRPPLVYGPGVRGNFAALIGLAPSRLPLPFAGIDNRRSLIARDNLVDLIARAATHPAASGMTLLCRDDDEYSTPALIRVLAAARGGSARLFAPPDFVWQPLRALPAIGPKLARLTGSLQVDDSATRLALGWRPPVTAAAALAVAARAGATRL